MKKIIPLFLFLAICGKLKGQNLFQDASGESNMYIAQQDPFGWIRFNSSDQSVALGYNHVRSAGHDFTTFNSEWSFFGGGDFKVNSKNGIANILKNDALSTGLAFNGNFGINTYNLRKKGNYSTIYLRGNINYDNLTYIYNSNSQAIIDKTNRFSGKLLANLNFQFNFDNTDAKTGNKYETYLFLGLSTGFSKVNNYGDLDDITATTYQFGSNTSVEAEKTTTGKAGQYTVYNAMPLNIDIGYTPRILQNNTIGFNSYFRTNFFKEKNASNAGLGLYIAKKDKPSNVIGGLAWQFNDLTNTLHKTGSLTEKSSVFFYVGYTISGK
jgi:hypothetical protein